VDALVDTVETGILDFRALAGVGRQIQQSIHVSPTLERYVVTIWDALRDPNGAGLRIEGVDMTRLVMGGASPRGLSFLARAARVHAWIAGRDMVVPEDVRAIFFETMAHRIFLDPIYENRSEILVRSLCDQVFIRVPVP
jgi:MoxR-like ATPase